MNVLITGTALLLLGVVVHLVYWKISIPKRQTRALCLIFLGTIFIGLGYLHLAAHYGFPLKEYALRGFTQYLHIAIFLLPMSLGYIGNYSGVEADSPSLVMVLEIAKAGPDGLDEGVFYERLSDDLLVAPRVRDLFRDEFVYEEGGKIRLTPKGRRFISIFIFYRRLLDAPLRGG